MGPLFGPRTVAEAAFLVAVPVIGLEALLAAVAVLAVAVAVFVAHRHRHHLVLPAGAGPWYGALAAAFSPAGRTVCGVKVGIDTVGVGHQQLPCGVRLYVRFGDRTVLTNVVDRGDVSPGRGRNW